MADWQAETRAAAERYGLDPNIFFRQIRQESGFNPTARSGAGALGIAQIMPATARGWGVDPLDPHAALNAAAKNMASYVKQFGSYKDALIAYNAGPGRVGKPLYDETANYINTILGGRDPGGLGSPARQSGSPSPAAGGSASGASAAPLIGSPGQAGDVTGLLSSLLAKPEQQAPAPMPLQAPSFAARPELPGGFSPLAQTAAPQASQETGVSQALGLLETLRGADPTSTASQGSEAADGPQMPPIAESVMAGQQPIAESVYRQRADQIDAAKLPYLWGGGHGGKVNVDKNLTPLDCSGAVSAVLGIDPRVSGQFTSWGKAGDGGNKGVTVFANAEHVLMKIDGHYWGTSKTNPGGGAGWIPQGAISKDYLSGFTARHL